MSSIYGGIEDAKGEGRFPFFSEKGRYTVAIVGWAGRQTRNSGPADFCDFKILKSNNPAVQPGEHRTRMRSIQGDAKGPALEEIKSRVLVGIQAKGVPGMDAASITPTMMDRITSADGGILKNAVIVVEIGDKVPTKRGKEFSPANYFVPTRADLDGLDLEALGLA